MPRGIKRRAKAKTEWTSEQRRQLVTGLEHFGFGFGRWPDSPTRPIDFDAVREAWAELGPEILDEFIREHPFRRPWGWWVVEAPEPRREAEEGDENENDRDRFGSPAWWAEYRGDATPTGSAPSSLCESERAYLVRLDLLTDSERAIVKAERHRKANPV
jgi:hypothetical protein